jgi:hypothetical protein
VEELCEGVADAGGVGTAGVFSNLPLVSPSELKLVMGRERRAESKKLVT